MDRFKSLMAKGRSASLVGLRLCQIIKNDKVWESQWWLEEAQPNEGREKMLVNRLVAVFPEPHDKWGFGSGWRGSPRTFLQCSNPGAGLTVCQ